MARPWQLRHKLVLGLGLVVASVGLLLGGALVTLSSYVEAGQVTVHRLALIQVVVILKQDLHEIAVTGPYTGNRDAEKQHILLRLAQAKKTICGTPNSKAVALMDADTKGLFDYANLNEVLKNTPLLGIPPRESKEFATYDEWVQAYEGLKSGI